jgi:hypothetical protein
MPGMKLCKGCPTPVKCKAAGKCLKKKMAMGGVATGMMPPNNAQQKQQIGGSMTPGMMNRGGMGKKKKNKEPVPGIMIAIAVPAKKGKKSASTSRKK